MVFNANDPSGAGGLTADITTIASVGAHPVPVVTGAYARDTAEVFDHFSMDDEAVTEQARAALEDVPVQVIKVGFVGSPENLSAIAELASDYPDMPVVAYMPNLSWWQDDQIDLYLDAFRELLLPQTTVLVGNHSTLWRWLLPDWNSDRNPGARDIASRSRRDGRALHAGDRHPAARAVHRQRAGIARDRDCAPVEFERFDAIFAGAGDTLSAALAALLASGTDLSEAFNEALSYLDHCLDGGFRPGMGHVIARPPVLGRTRRQRRRHP